MKVTVTVCNNRFDHTLNGSVTAPFSYNYFFAEEKISCIQQLPTVVKQKSVKQKHRLFSEIFLSPNSCFPTLYLSTTERTLKNAKEMFLAIAFYRFFYDQTELQGFGCGTFSFRAEINYQTLFL